MHYIYKITNTINDCIYIGYTGYQPEKRLLEHLSASRRTKTVQLITRAINKYGIENFSIEILKEFDDKEEALLSEIEFIANLRCNRARYKDGNGYNLHDGGNAPPSQLGRKYPNRRKNGTRPTKKNGHVRTYTEEGFERHVSHEQRGKTIEEIYGEDQANEIREKLLKRKAEAKIKKPKPTAKVNSKPPTIPPDKIQIVFDGQMYEVWGLEEAKLILNYSIAHISRMINGKSRLPSNITSIRKVPD